MEGALTARDRVGIQDFVLLDPYTSESAFLNNLRKRFNENLIYTYIGTLLVSVNPYKELGIYSTKQMDTYMGSGAGKTEASKKILQFYAASCPRTRLLDNVRDRLLLSNPVLEAFGNAKTLKNDNSSRFGKYMDIQFDFQGEAVGGHILSYLLEKSRVVHQNHGERNFHIFYQLGECAKVSSINDKNDWKTVQKALAVIDFSETDIESLFGIIASVLHLGNVRFDADARGYATLSNGSEVHWLSQLLGIRAQVLQEGLTHRKIEAREEQVLSPFTIDHAVYARDALAKAVYGRTFTWLVNKINESLANKDSTRKTVIGLLDIYGFEVFHWETVPYFNNKIICDLVEEKHRGIISVLVMRQSKNFIVKQCFPSTEPDTKKRPETVATQFKSSLAGLADILMAKEPWYVRCLKPNDGKQPGRFDDVLVRHQVKYLGLMEHLRVRRAGFAYRRRFEVFLQRYKPLCPDTWPNWKGPPAEGVERLVKHLGYAPDEYKMGKTKIFIRHARTLFATEDAYEVCKHKLATRIQAKYKGYRGKGQFQKQREAGAKGEREESLGREGHKEGFMTRNQPACVDNSEYLAFVRQNYLTRLKDNLPKTVLDKNTWLTPPPIMVELQLKGVASDLFKGKKENYPQSVPRPFVDTRIGEQDINMKVLQMIRHERIKVS
ncbi:hypothetical protein JZ751_005740, partial [Albula glossodonta]